MLIEIKPELNKILEKMDLGFAANSQNYKKLIQNAQALFMRYVIEEYDASKEELVSIAQKIAAFSYEADHWNECIYCKDTEIDECENCKSTGYVRSEGFIFY